VKRSRSLNIGREAAAGNFYPLEVASETGRWMRNHAHSLTALAPFYLRRTPIEPIQNVLASMLEVMLHEKNHIWRLKQGYIARALEEHRRT